jgi:hypothetical protein
VTSVAAFFAVLFTGRYPRTLFEFNVGVMRWSWRVAYYAYGALGTDRYPPFSLREDPDYPAHLEVDYPEKLSRGLVLVKWWLLAIPHYLVVGLFLGGLGTAVAAEPDTSVANVGLLGLLVLVAAMVLLFTGRYPRRVFDLVLGLNRWVIRVAAYVALMTDRYPPFALDQGGHEDGPGTMTLAAPGPPADAPAARQSVSADAPGRAPRRGWTAGRVTSLVGGSLLALAALGLAVPAVAAALLDHTGRDSAGFVMSSDEQLATSGYALTSTSMRMHLDGPWTFAPHRMIGDARMTVSSTGERPLFVGIARSADVSTYLAGVDRSTVTGFHGDGPSYRHHGGGAPATAPSAQPFWAAHADGTHQLTVTWPVSSGDWTVVVMNADGTPGVHVTARAGAELPVLGPLSIGLAVGAVLLAVPGVLLIAHAARSAGRPAAPRQLTEGDPR